MTIHKEGYKFIAIFFVITLILSKISCVLCGIGCVLTLWCAYFFRNPTRVISSLKDVVVSPADGRIVDIKEVDIPDSFGLEEKKAVRLSIFLNVFDVHLNRSPVSGIVKKVLYHPGQFINASFDKASDLNERNVVVVETPDGKTITFVQIAGLIARRICCDVQVGDTLKRGDMYGLIRFGSRVDIYLPMDAKILVQVGQYMIGGETLLATFKPLDL